MSEAKIKQEIQSILEKIIFHILTNENILFGFEDSDYIPQNNPSKNLSELISHGTNIIYKEFHEFQLLLKSLSTTEKQSLSKKYFNSWIFYYYENVKSFSNLLTKAIPILNGLCGDCGGPMMDDYCKRLLKFWKSIFSNQFSETVETNHQNYSKCRDCGINNMECLYHCETCESREKNVYGVAHVCTLCYKLKTGTHVKNHYNNIKLITNGKNK
jgi:hypothetical protein